MRVQLVVAAAKHTGAAAVAELTCRALQAVDVDVNLLFRRGRNLEARLAGKRWADPGLRTERSPADLVNTLRVLRERAAECDVMVVFLPHDLIAARLAGVTNRTALVWNVRNPRHLRTDPFHRSVLARLAGVIVSSSAMAERVAALEPGIGTWVGQVPLEDRFRPGLDGERWRRRLGIPVDHPVLGMVGKVAPGRGFEMLVDVAARLDSATHVLAVGHGEARPALEKRARRLGIHDRLHWAGYQEEELPYLYCAMDVVLFAAAGSDWGHRMISEAQGCGRAVVAGAVDGVAELVTDGQTGIVAATEPGVMAAAVQQILLDGAKGRRLGRAAAEAADRRRFALVGIDLRQYLEHLVASAKAGA